MKELTYPFDSEYILKKKRSLKKQLLSSLEGEKTQKVKIAILGGSTTNDIKLVLELFLLDQKIEPTFYESEYNRYYEDAMFDNPELFSFAPDYIFVHTTSRNIMQYPLVTESEAQIEEKLEKEYRRFEMMWDHLRETYHCGIIQNNFELLSYRLLGNMDQSDFHGKLNFIQRLNMKFYEYARAHEQFWIHDIQYLSAQYGIDRWADPFYWYMYKYAMCVSAIPAFSYNLSLLFKSILGKNKKAFAIDLDNTLWGGIVGDDGVENLELGEETAVGEAYLEFQRYISEFRQMGIPLSIVSKNDHENAIAGLSHEASVLHEKDFISIKANWEPKAMNLAQIAQELSLLPESFVFLDDNPAEREIILSNFPRAGVPELGKIEQYRQVIDHSGFFEVTALSEDDLKRTRMYEENAKRSQYQKSFVDYKDYLLSLEMKGTIAPFEPVYASRIAQLTNKSNQFNLTTRRMTQSEIEMMMTSDQYITLYGKLEDKFGDNGVVSVVIGEKKENELDLILWLMSCRVLKRDMEQAMLDTLVSYARKQGIEKMNGYYYKTAKNSMVKDFYETMGFVRLTPDEEEESKQYVLTNLDTYTNQNHVITVIGGNENE